LMALDMDSQLARFTAYIIGVAETNNTPEIAYMLDNKFYTYMVGRCIADHVSRIQGDAYLVNFVTGNRVLAASAF